MVFWISGLPDWSMRPLHMYSTRLGLPCLNYRCSVVVLGWSTGGIVQATIDRLCFILCLGSVVGFDVEYFVLYFSQFTGTLDAPQCHCRPVSTIFCSAFPVVFFCGPVPSQGTIAIYCRCAGLGLLCKRSFLLLYEYSAYLRLSDSRMGCSKVITLET